MTAPAQRWAPLNEYVAIALRTFREQRKLSQRDAARLLCMSPANLCKYESGANSPNVHLLERFAAVYRCEPSALLCLAELLAREDTER